MNRLPLLRGKAGSLSVVSVLTNALVRGLMTPCCDLRPYVNSLGPLLHETENQQPVDDNMFNLLRRP